LTATFKKLWANEYFQTAITIAVIIIAVFGFWYGSQAVLNTNYPALAVVSGSMCTLQDGACNGWTHPFARTLHIGDLIIIQGVNPATLSADYPNSDIIVFHRPSDPSELIVHRIVAKEEINGKYYFRTKGDGNNFDKWPTTPQPSEYDPWVIPQDMVVGKVILRIPWVGHLVLFMHDSVGVPVVIFLIILLIIAEFIFPLLRKKPAEDRADAVEPRVEQLRR
jgi:signal peptidase I